MGLLLPRDAAVLARSRESQFCPPICLSDTRVLCDKTKQCTADILTGSTVHKGNHSSFLTQAVVNGRRPLPSEICALYDPPAPEKRRLRQISAYNVSTVRDSEKVQL